MQPLEGIVVLDLSRVLAGPFCSMILADLGAEVIKVEEPGRGDETRSWGPPFAGSESAYYLSINRNKKSIAVDLKREEGRRIIYALAKRADVALENFRPGVVKRLGVDYQTLKALNPRLVYCSISGFGQEGPYRDLPAYDIILQGMGGIMGITGEKGRSPVKVGIPLSDLAAGLQAALGILAALLHREWDGEGQFLDISMLACQVFLLATMIPGYFLTGIVPEPMGSGHASIVPYQAFRTKDIFINIAVTNEKFWRAFCRALGRPELAEDPRFATNAKRVEHREALLPIIEAILLTKTGEEWIQILRQEGIPCGPILPFDRLFADLQARQMVRTLDHQAAGSITVVGTPFKLSLTPAQVSSPPPTLGQHTEEVLAALGYTSEAIRSLREEGVIG